MIVILTKKTWAICFWLAAIAGLGCSGRATLPPSTQLLDSLEVSDASIADAATSGVSEAEAREILDRAFRDAGLRVVNDHRWQRSTIEVTLDGFDPEREIGYEYVAAAERGTELDAGELEELQRYPGILIVHPASASALRERAEDFLSTIRAPDGGE